MIVKKIDSFIEWYINNIIKFNVYIYNNASKIIKKNIKPIIIFLKTLIKCYLISKYSYKIDNIDFVRDIPCGEQIYYFFVILNRLKEFFIKEEPQNQPLISVVCYYVIMVIGILYYAPIG